MITVNKLLDYCLKQIAKWNGDKVVWVVNDDDGNGIHELPCWFTTDKEEIDAINCYGECKDTTNIVVLG